MSFWQKVKRGEMLLKSGQVTKIIFLGDLLIEKRSIGFGQFGLFLLGIDKFEININIKLEKSLVSLCKNQNCLFVQVETYNLKKEVFGDNSSVKKVEKDLDLHNQIKKLSESNLNRRQFEDVQIEFLSLQKGENKENLTKKQEVPFIKKELNLDIMSIINSSFRTGYYKKFITPYTAIIDLSKSEETILSEMKPKGRYNINLTTKKDIEVLEVKKTDKNIEVFYELLCETTSRDGFSGNNIYYYKTFLESIDNSKLIIAYKDNKPIAAGIFIFDKEVSIYYYGASTNNKDYRNMMAPYLLQWTAIKKAKEIGSKYYDFLGVATPGETNSPLAGVTDFKSKLAKDIVNVSESYIWVNNKFLYKLIEFVRKMKGKK